MQQIEYIRQQEQIQERRNRIERDLEAWGDQSLCIDSKELLRAANESAENLHRGDRSYLDNYEENLSEDPFIRIAFRKFVMNLRNVVEAESDLEAKMSTQDSVQGEY